VIKLSDGSGFLSRMRDDLSKAKKSLIVISPYITLPAVTEIIKALPTKQLQEKIIITLPFGIEYLTGSIQLKALKELKNKGFSIQYIKNLHSKIYLIDHQTAYIGSSNFTAKGWGLVPNANVEVMIKLQLSDMEYSYINKIYLAPSEQLDILEEWCQIIKESKQMLGTYNEVLDKMKALIPLCENKPYSEFLNKLKEQNIIKSFSCEKDTKKFGKNVYMIDDTRVKVLYSSLHNRVANYEYNYKFGISKTSVEQAKRNNLDFFIFLERANKADVGFVSLPSFFMKKSVLIPGAFNGKECQFQISANAPGTDICIRFICKIKTKPDKEVKYELAGYRQEIQLPIRPSN
jgi:ribosomal protein S25